MSRHQATVEWKRSGGFRYETCSRADTLWFLHLACRKNEWCFIANSVKSEALIEPC